MTIGEALIQGTAKLKNTSLSPRLDAEVLLGYILKQDRAKVLINEHKDLTPSAARKFTSFINKRAGHIPIPYIIGHTEFFGLRLQVTPAVLVPRPFTELLIEELLHVLTSRSLYLIIVDIGTGSGAIGLSLATHLPKSKVIATDVSSAALRLAKINARSVQVNKQLTWRRGRLLRAVRATDNPQILIANLPYLAKRQLREPSIRREPKVALDGGPKGMKLIQQLFKQLENFPTIKIIALEFDPSQYKTIRLLVKKWSSTATIKPVSDGRHIRGLIATS